MFEITFGEGVAAFLIVAIIIAIAEAIHILIEAKRRRFKPRDPYSD